MSDKNNEQKKLKTPLVNDRATTENSLYDWYTEALNHFSVSKQRTGLKIDSVAKLIPPTKPTLH